jgi:hypothetical protein
MTVNRRFIVKNGLEVAEKLIFADGNKDKVGINTVSLEYDLDVNGDVALTGRLFVTPKNSVSQDSGTFFGNNPFFIAGVNTSLYRVNDILDDGPGGFIANNTRVTSIGISSIGILPSHGVQVGSAVTSYSITRRVTSGQNKQVLTSRGPNLSPIWEDPKDEVIIEESFENGVKFLTFVDGDGEQVLKITPDQLSFIPSSGNFGVGTNNPTAKLDVVGDANFTDTVTAPLFEGDLLADNVETENLLVTGISTFESNSTFESDVSFESDVEIESDLTINIGNLGIGVQNPSEKLEVDGNGIFSGNVTADFFVGIASTTVDVTILDKNSNQVHYPTFVTDSGSEVININKDTLSFIPNSGSLGLGTDSPQRTLDVIGDISFTDRLFVRSTPGTNEQVLISRGPSAPAQWVDPEEISQTTVDDTNENKTFYPLFTDVTSGVAELKVDSNSLAYNPSTNRLGINKTNPATTLDVGGDVTAFKYFGDGENLVGIVTQIISGIGLNQNSTQSPGKGVVTLDAYKPVGKTIYVSQNGDDNNTGLAENHPKRTIKAAATAAIFGDTIKVFPGVYVEENPIILKKTVSVEGTELRNCVVTPKYPYLDLFHVNNGCHITDMSFIGPEMTDGAAVVALQPLEGVSVDRYFDAARLIRNNLDFIARETVGFLTSGFSGFAGSHREQDAARLIDLNINYIAAESVGFLTTGLGFSVPGPGTTGDCADDIRDIFRSVSYDLKANSNRKSVGAALSYFGPNGELLHLTGIGVSEATVQTLQYATELAQLIINNQSPSTSYQSGIGSIPQIIDPSVIQTPGGCVGVANTISQLVGIVTTAIAIGNTSQLPSIRFGVTLESQDCADDIKDIWKCVIHDITRGGNSRCVDAGKAYYDVNFNLIPQILKNPGEVEQTVASVDYSFNIARAVINNSTWGGYPAGLGTDVVNAVYDANTGITTITANNHNLSKDDAVKIVGLGFTCPSGPGIVTYPSGALGYIFNVLDVSDSNNFEVVVGQSTLPHTYVSGGTIQKYEKFGHDFYQLKDVSIQPDPLTGFNNAIDGCANVVSAIHSCVGIVTNIVGLGSTAFSTVGIKTTYPGNSGIGFTSVIGITSAVYNKDTGRTTIIAPGFNVVKGDQIELRELAFSCPSNGSGISTQLFPSGKYGYDFSVDKVNLDGSFDVFVGPSTLPHTYEGGGVVVNRAVAVTTAVYDNTTGVTTITAPGAFVREGDLVALRDLEFSCPSGPAILKYPSGNEGYNFTVDQVIGVGSTFVVTVGVSTLPHFYEGGGVVIPPFSRGVGPITQGPYVRNCTNFIPKSIGMKVDGFDAEPGDKDDIGVTGTMSVDSYTQYNQGGIGVSITNGAYSQLVSIFTICDDIAIFTGSGGQCDITNSNSSFGNLGLVSNGVGDETTGSIYRYTGIASSAQSEQPVIGVSGIGNLRPYDGQALYFGELYYEVRSIKITNGGIGYTQPPRVTVDFPTGPNGIRAEAISTIDAFGRVVSIDMISPGNQYRISDSPQITIAPPDSGITATAEPELYPLYYTIQSATLPSAGISTITLNTNLNNDVGAGTTAYFTRLSLQIVSSHSFEWVGSGNDINIAKPALGGVVRQENEVVKINGGEVFYTSTDQAGNFRIGDDFVINQLTGTVTGRSFDQSILNNVTPLIIALGR